MITTVVTVAGLMAALQTAQPGDTIQLAAGTYRNIAISNFTGAVTIASADPANPANLRGLNVNNSSGIAFQNLDLQPTGTRTTIQTAISASSNISFDHLTIHGGGTDPTYQPKGLVFNSDSNISVTNTTFSVLSTGAAVTDCNVVTFSGNSFNNIRTNGINTTGSSNIIYSLNDFSNFFPAANDHPDAIQFWPDAANPQAQSITLSGNTFERGSGGPVHGIFMRGSVTQPWSFSQVTIQNNIFSGASFDGIMVSFAQFVNIYNNILQAYTDLSPSAILLQNADQLILSNNQAGKFMFVSLTNITESGDVIIGPITPPPLGPQMEGMKASYVITRAPEPETWLLLGSGLASAGLALRGRRRLRPLPCPREGATSSAQAYGLIEKNRWVTIAAT